MGRVKKTILCLAMVASGLAMAAGPQTPADAPTPALTYRSAFEGYRAWRDEPVGDWRAANDTVGRIGGWRAYAREAAAPEPVEPAPPRTAQPAPPPPAPPAHDHGSHRP
jgi:hypothetical protein